MKKLLLATLLAWFPWVSSAEPEQPDWYQAFSQHQFDYNGHSLPYRMLLPENFDPNKRYPLLVFLHGAGERGDDNQVQLVHGSKLMFDSRSQFPAIVIFPQAAKEDYWAIIEADRSKLPFKFDYPVTGDNDLAPTVAMQGVIGLIQELRQQPYVDNSRTYVMGLSMGGMGTLELLGRKPEWFAAAISICGGANPALASHYNPNLALRLYHGGKDDVVVPQHSKDMYAALAKLKRDVSLKIYPDANHNSWDSTFAEPDLLSWLFSHKQ